MALEEKIKPVGEKHSIKEAVISLFLAAPIIKPERFKQLIETEFVSTFHQFEPIVQIQFQVKNQLGKPPNLSQDIKDNAGFKFTSFDKGQPVRILQGLNDTGNSRIYISYHALNYDRWAPFLSDSKNAISVISEFNKGLFVTAIGLQYLDEFQWLSNEEIDQKLIFNNTAAYIPKEFFSSTLNQYSILTEKENDHGRKYSDRLEIKVERLIKPSITILHNMSQVLSDVTDLASLVAGNDFEQYLALAHNENKKVLRDILTKEAVEMIKL